MREIIPRIGIINNMFIAQESCQVNLVMKCDAKLRILKNKNFIFKVSFHIKSSVMDFLYEMKLNMKFFFSFFMSIHGFVQAMGMYAWMSELSGFDIQTFF